MVLPGTVLLSGLTQVLEEYGREPPQHQTALYGPTPRVVLKARTCAAQPYLFTAGEHVIRKHVEDKMSDFFEATGTTRPLPDPYAMRVLIGLLRA
eukprot:2367313-Rhodomonas_salina.2